MNSNKPEIEQVKEDFHETLLMDMSEMARLDGGIVVRNDNDDKKFAHFHWNNVHFAFKRNCPKNATEVKEMIAFPKEINRLSNHQFTELAKLLNSEPIKKRGTYPNVYSKVLDYWETLNERDADYID